MKISNLLPFSLVCSILLPVEAFGFGAILHYQGDEGDREAYFADLRVISNRTPANQVGGPTEIREIDVTAVYENVDKPELAHMKLQFECPSHTLINMSNMEVTENKNKVKAGDSVKFRIGQFSYKLRRSDLKSEPLAVSDWKTSNASMLSKAGAIACNDIEIDHALHDAIKSKDFDFDGFGKRISKLGLPADMPIIGQVTAPEFLDFAWYQLWFDKVATGKRPDPSGKWAKKLTKEEKEAAIKKLEEQRKALQANPEIIAAKNSLMEGIKKSNAERAASASAATRPDGKRLTPIESNLMTLWKGKPEGDVVKVMGNPEFNQAGDSRFLRYTKWWEKESVTAYGAYGNVVGSEIGGYAECFVEFKTKQDSSGEWRVDDILVRSNYEGAGLGRQKGLCQDLASEASGTF